MLKLSHINGTRRWRESSIVFSLTIYTYIWQTMVANQFSKQVPENVSLKCYIPESITLQFSSALLSYVISIYTDSDCNKRYKYIFCNLHYSYFFTNYSLSSAHLELIHSSQRVGSSNCSPKSIRVHFH